MRFVVGVLACAGAVNLALADDPPPAPAASAAAAPSIAAAAATPASAATSVTTAAAAAKPAVDPDVQHFTQEGFKPEMRHGQEVYCRKELATGSRVSAVKNCGTIEDLKLQEQRAKTEVEQGQRQQSMTPASK
ncbi:MAG: hypothetical protein ACLPTM_02835 [Steroidobacteraceae bacterium]